MRNLRYIKESIKVILFLLLLLLVPFFLPSRISAQENTSCIWKICSIDTMKTSRDRARAELNNPSFDRVIEQEVRSIKDAGANYVAIDTPYDNEFLPYLKRWIRAARKVGLSIWFRGNWSSWEGWFEYEKNMTPDEHIEKTYEFIVQNPYLFEDGDIFDACPECENAGHWPQPARDEEFREFIRKQKSSLDKAFGEIGKDVNTNVPSIIGGRAKEVLDQKTLDHLDKVVAIDHHFKDPPNITEYIKFFYDKYKTKMIVSEVGAPIPDINGEMTEDEQAKYMDEVLNNIYKSGERVLGINYWVLSDGTTALLNPDGGERKVYAVLRKYFNPGIIRGRITNRLGDRLEDVEVETSDGIKVRTDNNGNYVFKIPERKITLSVGGETYGERELELSVSEKEEKTQNFVLEPKNPSVLYRIRLFLHNILK